MQNILLIDNNDSFTYNLVQIIEENGCKITLLKNSEISGLDVEEFDGIVISPGPGNPSDYKSLFEFLEENHKKRKILGVCLGHQVIGEFFGGKNVQLSKVHHGSQSQIEIIADSILFQDLSHNQTLIAGRYHSWALDANSFPDCLKITSLDNEGTIMSLEHIDLPIFGVQFHPESYITDFGEILIHNWLNVSKI
ncbi:MAG: hypothetical protein A2X64_02025 [Ignavibacteria bacterium GWF2_33_9]|nr:MAG: hypothetical protein A2X64_02025 [Ignavibacteria bacterium GWF2_33_9]